jgi:transposase
MTQRRLSDKEKIEVVEKFKTGNYSYAMLSKEFNITLSSIRSLIKRRGVEAPKESYFYNSKRKYTLNQHYFDIIDTEEKAYFLGLLYADGCNYEYRNTVVMSLIEVDKEILEKFNYAIGSNRPLMKVNVKTDKRQEQYRIHFDSKLLSKSLSKLGCHYKKTFTLSFPTEEQVPSHLIRHFIRGYFDGDGSVSWWRTKKKNRFVASIDFVSTELFCIFLSEYFIENIGITSKIKKRHKDRNNTIRQLNIHGNKQIIKFLNWLYQDSSIYLQRKFNKTVELCREYENVNSLKPNLTKILQDAMI